MDFRSPSPSDLGRCVKCGKEGVDRLLTAYCPDCEKSRPRTGAGSGRRWYRWTLFPKKLEPGPAGLFKARVYLFFVGVLFVAIGLICVVLVTEPDARREMSGVVGFGVPRFVWATLGGAGIAFAIPLFYSAVTGRVRKNWIRRLIKLLATDVPDMS
jgi:hypothetical protein